MSDLLAKEILETMRDSSRDYSVISEIVGEKPLIIIEVSPPPIIQRNLIRQYVGKRLYDSGYKKIMASPKDCVYPSAFMDELVAINFLNAQLKSDMEGMNEDTAFRPRIHTFHVSFARDDEGLES